jgi:CubicO group peptidase (beta-lactamase class C family)
MNYLSSCLMMSFAMMVAIPAVASEYYQPGPSATGRVSAENWDTGENRRYALHNFEKVVRYTSSVRPTEVRKLQKGQDLNIGDLPEVNYLTNTTSFSGIVAIKDDTIIYEKYASDFGPTQQHSCQSSTKTINNLLVGKLVAEGKLDLDAKIKSFYPDMGSGYAEATVQQVLDMDVVNDYTEGYGDPDSPIRSHESASGWRPYREDIQDNLREYLKTIESADITNDGKYHYKSTNTDVIGMVIEAASGRPLHELVREVMVASGFENTGYISTDGFGVPANMGGLVLTTRDFARFGMLLRDGGKGVNDKMVGGGESFIQQTLKHDGATMGLDKYGLGDFRYSNSTYSNGRFFGHAGWGGQYLYVDPEHDLVIAFHSTLENESGIEGEYALRLMKMPLAVSKYLDEKKTE